VKREAAGEESGPDCGKSLPEEGGRSELRWGQRKRLRYVRTGSAGSAGMAVSWTSDAWSSREDTPHQHPGHPPRPRHMSVTEGLGDVERPTSVGDEAQHDSDDPFEKKAKKATSRIRHSGSASSNSSGGQGSQLLEAKGSESAPSGVADGKHRADKDQRASGNDNGGAGAPSKGGEENGEGSDAPRTTKDPQHLHSKASSDEVPYTLPSQMPWLLFPSTGVKGKLGMCSFSSRPEVLAGGFQPEPGQTPDFSA